MNIKDLYKDINYAIMVVDKDIHVLIFNTYDFKILYVEPDELLLIINFYKSDINKKAITKLLVNDNIKLALNLIKSSYK